VQEWQQADRHMQERISYLKHSRLHSTSSVKVWPAGHEGLALKYSVFRSTAGTPMSDEHSRKRLSRTLVGLEERWPVIDPLFL